MRIVIADDSGTARMVIRRCLSIIGLADADIHEAGHGAEALELLKESATDLLITDLNMPVMTGEQLLKRVKGSPRLTGIPVLVITSAGNQAKETELLSLGAFGVLNKPVSPALLLQRLEPIID